MVGSMEQSIPACLVTEAEAWGSLAAAVVVAALLVPDEGRHLYPMSAECFSPCSGAGLSECSLTTLVRFRSQKYCLTSQNSLPPPCTDAAFSAK